MVIIFVNMGTVWITGYLARFDLLSFGLNYYGLVLANALVHILPCVIKGGQYNPGLLTAVAMFLPASYMVYGLMLEQQKCRKRDLGRATVIVRVKAVCTFGKLMLMIKGLAGHVIIVASLQLFRYGITNEAITCLIQLLNVLPLAIK